MSTERTSRAVNEQAQGNLVSYIVGFILSIILTLSAYFLVVNKLLSGNTLVGAIVFLAVLQLLVQLVFFLHLGRESGPRWNLFMFLSMLLIVAIVVVGSLWIMHNLDYHMMPPEQVDSHMLEQKDKGF